MISKVLFGAAIVLSAAVGIAAPASAEPSPFGTLGCSCQPPVSVPDAKTPATGQVDQGIQNGLGYLHSTPPRAANN